MFPMSRICGFGGGRAPVPLPAFVLAATFSDNGGGTVRTTTPGATIPAGSLAVLISAKGSGNSTLTSVTDGVGNTWTIRQASGASGAAIAISTSLLAFDIVSGTSITHTWDTAQTGNHYIIGYISNPSGSPIDQSALAHATSATPSVTSGVTIQAAEVAIGGVMSSTGSVVTESASWTRAGQTPLTSGQLTASFKVLAATGAQTYDPTFNGSNSWAAVILTLKTA